MVGFRSYAVADRAACLALFDANCPEYFAPNERADYAEFLDTRGRAYEVCTMADEVVGAYGLYPAADGGSTLHWILLHPRHHGKGLGAAIMTRVDEALRESNAFPLHISASHKSAPFFARFGAVELERIVDGWGPGMHRVEMRYSR